jgi:hypothetical protein
MQEAADNIYMNKEERPIIYAAARHEGRREGHL